MLSLDRIHIIGGPGSGKSYLAAALSERLECPHTDLDTLYWNSDFSQKTEAGDRRLQLDRVVAADQWIIEGAYCGAWLNPSFEASDIIIKLETNPLLQKARLARRLGGRIMRGETNLHQSLNLLRWVDGFESSLDNLSSVYNSKLTPIIGKTGVSAYLADLQNIT
ncbi:DNA topology modulation protein FlaR [Candidatus Saccharibacteria bacterium]|nr:DNA topology modulation protein FlaR [Candidatus Saccharibacteria bacterium]